MLNGTTEEKWPLIRTYVKRIEFYPKNNVVSVVFYPPYLAETIKREQELPRISYGVGGGT